MLAPGARRGAGAGLLFGACEIRGVAGGDHSVCGVIVGGVAASESVMPISPAVTSVRGFGTPLQPAWGRLVLIGPGGVEAETHYLRHPQVVFGRELGDIVFPADPFVSWQHAQLGVEVAGEATGVTLTDLRSANGTYLRARGDVILDPGDMFRIGDQIFRVRMH